ncbi:ribonuclease P/MRP protein subunit POP5 [Rhinichthys klamathensis goyatoka]|uniref:ribonuclease P/MRP protein subunit POP5 n=1 Tax=Rhinichthys klamathensis goyatoka TaxID=3034132 RepID=UPI0024B6205D|nr:ribonuclease P/MRP protein subunit POP5 [Rhinichthys klamathensis goyatoka]
MVRFKSRYLLCEICFSERSSLPLLEDKALYHTVRAAVNRAHGDYGSAHFNIGVTVKYLNAHTGVVLIRCRKGQYRLIWSALTFITCLENRGQRVPCFFNCLHVGGTIRTCQKFLVKYNRQQLDRMLLDCKTDAEKQEVRRAILSCSLSAVREEEAYEDWSDDNEEI